MVSSLLGILSTSICRSTRPNFDVVVNFGLQFRKSKAICPFGLDIARPLPENKGHIRRVLGQVRDPWYSKTAKGIGEPAPTCPTGTDVRSRQNLVIITLG
jgi:hypothetical protein